MLATTTVLPATALTTIQATATARTVMANMPPQLVPRRRSFHWFIIADIEQAPSISVPDLKAAKMRDGPSHQPVLNGDLTTRVSHTTEAANNKPRRADLEPMQRWVDENAKEGPWNSVNMPRD